MSTPENAYQELAQILRDRGNRTLEIEILPPDVGPLLQDDCSIGITKKHLVQAFIAARRIFFRHLGSSPDLQAPAIKDPDVIARDDPSIASEIILLFDCEHLTACNWRRNRLGAWIRSRDLHMDDVDRERLLRGLEAERSLMTTYLCSPLHRHTKSPTLWQHRFWLLSHIIDIYWSGVQSVALRPESYQSVREAIHQTFQTELAVVLRAGELHPRNYYAFHYMRQLHAAVAGRLDEMDKTPNSSSRLALSIAERTLEWCLAHPADISGWMFLLYLLEAVPDRNIRLESIARAVEFAMHVRWEGESLWTFVHLATVAFGVVQAVWDYIDNCEQCRSTDPVTMEEDGRDGTGALQKSWKTWMARAKSCWTGDRRSISTRLCDSRS